jgi:phage tail sheath protein FI
MTSYNHPGVFLNELPLAVTPTATNGTSSAAGAVVAQFEKGPNVVTKVTSWYEFQNMFGTFNSGYPATYSVHLFFQNGGDALYVRRVLDVDAPTATASLFDTASTPKRIATLSAKYKGNDGTKLRVKLANKSTKNGKDYYDVAISYDAGVADTIDAGKVTAGSADNTPLETFLQVSFDQPDSSDYISNVLDYGSKYVKLATFSPLTITASASASSGATSLVLTSAAHGLAVGDEVTIAGLASPLADYNGVDAITAVTTDTFTITIPALAANLTAQTGLTGATAVKTNVRPITADKVLNTTDLTPFQATASTTPVVATDYSSTVFNEFNIIDQPLVVFVPDAVVKFNSTDALSISNRAITWADTNGSGFVVLDTPRDQTVADALAYSNSVTASSRAALYYPHIFIKDANGNSGSAVRKSPVSGAIVGLYLTNDKLSGPFKTPAGISTKITQAVALEKALTGTELDSLNSNTFPINAIRNIPGSGIVVMGGRTTLQDGTANKYIAMRRSLIYIEKNLKELSEFAVFEPNTESLWGNILTTLGNFLNTYRNQGGLRGGSPAESYYVKCDAENNTATTIAQGFVNIEVGVALEYPAEFVVINLRQLTGQ